VLRSCRKTFSSLDGFEEHYDCTQEVRGVVSIAAITGEGCVVIQRRLLFRLVLAMVLLELFYFDFLGCRAVVYEAQIGQRFSKFFSSRAPMA
jgi:hypothetical protein